MKEQLCRDIELMLCKKLSTPRDFDNLSKMIFNRLNVMVSSTTLKRIWGYIREDVEPRPGTLDILAQFLGYHDVHDYLAKRDQTDAIDSNPVLGRRINVEADLSVGDRLMIRWLPDRECEILYEGDNSFLVTDTRNTRLRKGDTFRCYLILEGEPLYLDNLTRRFTAPTSYVCGKQSGVRFERLGPLK